MKVFLGGTCNGSKWREELIPMLKMDYFNPVVDDWNEEAQQREIYEREHCDFVLYVITPKMKGVYSIAEVIDDVNKKPHKTLFCVLEKDEDKHFTKEQMHSLNAVKRMVKNNGGATFSKLEDVAEYLNNRNIKFMDINEFREKGYLQEANRRFFHPLGLALSIDITNNTLAGVWDYRDDPEGMYFDLKNSDKERIKRFRKNAKFIDKEFEKRKKTREKLFGDVIEPIP